MTLRLRIATALAIVAFSVGAFAAIVSYLTTAHQIAAGIDNSLKSGAAAAATAVASPGSADHRGGDPNREPGDTSASACPDAAIFQFALAAELVSADGSVRACIAGAPALPGITGGRSSLLNGTTRLVTISVGGSNYRVLSTPWVLGGTLQVAQNLHETDALLTKLRFQLAIALATATTAAAALGWLIATRLARPITRLRDTAHHIATTLDYSTPVIVSGPGEVGSLATSFSAMVNAVSHSQEQQRRLVADASHEMRTPLTSLRSNLELIRRIERLPPPERSEVVGDILVDVDELSTLLAELVDLASDLSASEPTETVVLSDLARTVAARTHRRHQRHVSIDERHSATVQARPRQLERAINNLVDNSIKYSPSDTTIEIRLDGTTVTVLDRGPGIPCHDLERIFDRFYRTAEARPHPGSGLGLAIVDEIVRTHGGAVFARNRPGGGAEIGFELYESG